MVAVIPHVMKKLVSRSKIMHVKRVKFLISNPMTPSLPHLEAHMPGRRRRGLDGKRSASPARFPVWEFSNQPHIAGHVTWEWDVPGNIVLFSREWRHIMLSPDDPTLETTISSWWPRVHEDDVVPFLEMARDIVEGKTEHYQTLFRVQRNDGSWAWLLSRGRVTEKRDGTVYRVSGALMDISALRSDVKFQHGNGAAGSHAMLDNSPDLIVRMDEDLIPLYTNPQLPRHLTWAKLESGDLHEAATLGIDPEQLEFFRENIKRVFAEGTAVRKVMTFATAYGHDVTGEYSFWPEYDGEGKVVAAMTQFRDLTDHVLAERRAKLNEIRLDALYRLSQMDSAPEEEVLRFVVDSMIRLTESKSGLLFFPKKLPGLEGRTVWSQYHFDAIGKEHLPEDMLPLDMKALAVGTDGGGAARVIRNGNCLQPVNSAFGGRLEILRYMIAPVTDNERTVLIAGVSNKDTEYRESDLRQLEAFVNAAWFILRRHEFVRELRRAKEAAEKANKVKDEFLANVSHELRTPLNGMLSMLKLLDYIPLSEDQREYLHAASISGETLLRIISDILDFSRIESGKMQLRNEPFDFREAIGSSLDMFRREAAKQGLVFGATIDEAIPPVLTGDEARVRQILFNIVGNAIKFTEKGGIDVVISLLRQSKDGVVRIYFCVRDTGIGIPLEKQNTIFEAFTQIDSSSTKKYPGTGLGLSIVKHLLDLMDGSITIESEVGSGTAIHASLTFTLPDGAGAAHFEETDDPSENVPLDILVAEDDAVARLAMRAFLERNGHRPVCVENGKQALEALMLYPFHCLFTDIQMPGMDGLEVVRRIRDNDAGNIYPCADVSALIRERMPDFDGTVVPIPRNIPTVAVSAHAMSGDKERFLASGMDFYLSKPVIMKELQQVLREISERIGKP